MSDVLYRAAQEGLTNARRHAPGAPVVLGLVRDRHDDVERVGFRLANPAGPRPTHPTVGRGLVGVRERVEALGGSVSAVRVDAEFVLDVRLPVPTAPSHATTGAGPG